MAFRELLKVHSVKHVEQKAFDGGVSNRGFPGCVDCRDSMAHAVPRNGFRGPGGYRRDKGRAVVVRLDRKAI